MANKTHSSDNDRRMSDKSNFFASTESYVIKVGHERRDNDSKAEDIKNDLHMRWNFEEVFLAV